MRSPRRTSHRDATTVPVQEVTIPAGRRVAPTYTRLRTRRVPVVMYVMALLVIPGLVVAGFMSAGIWASTGSSVTAQAGTPTQEGVVHAAPVDPADVKGSMTLQQVVDAFPPTTAAQVLATFSAPLDTPTSTQLKDLVEDGGGMDIPGLRTWLQEQATR